MKNLFARTCLILSVSALIFTACNKEKEPQIEPVDPATMGTITGTVFTQNGKTPVGAAKVFIDVKGEVYLTTTNREGNFSLEAPAGERELIIHTGDGSLFRVTAQVEVVAGKEDDAGTFLLKQAGQLAYIPGSFDEIETIVIDSLGYTATQLSVPDLSNLSTLSAYSAIFLNCGLPGSLDSLKYANLASYVANGGSLYASDWAVEYLTGDGNWKRSNNHTAHHATGNSGSTKAACNTRIGGFIPDSLLCTDKFGSTGLVTSCAIIDAGIQTALGKTTMDIDYDLGGWEMIQQLGPQFNILIEQTNGYGALAVRSNVNANWGNPVNGGGNSSGNNNNWVTICHIPPGNPNNPQTITISVNALAAHLAHGCSVGSCNPDGGIFYTTFHNHPQGQISSDVKNVLQYFILNL